MKIEIRENKVILDGYVNAVERFSKPLSSGASKFIERIMPETFKNALDKNKEVKVLLNHNHDREVANTSDGSANLYEDAIGLRAIVEISDSVIVEKAKEKKLSGWSFGFKCNSATEEENADGILERTVTDIDLIEVSILDDTKTPAYIGTVVEARDGDFVNHEYRNTSFINSDFNIAFEDLTNLQKNEMFHIELRKIFDDDWFWLQDYNKEYVYVNYESKCNKIPYTYINNTLSINIEEKVQVISSGYKEVRDVPEHIPKKNKEMDFSAYENRLKKLGGK